MGLSLVWGCRPHLEVPPPPCEAKSVNWCPVSPVGQVHLGEPNHPSCSPPPSSPSPPRFSPAFPGLLRQGARLEDVGGLRHGLQELGGAGGSGGPEPRGHRGHHGPGPDRLVNRWVKGGPGWGRSAPSLVEFSGLRRLLEGDLVTDLWEFLLSAFRGNSGVSKYWPHKTLKTSCRGSTATMLRVCLF